MSIMATPFKHPKTGVYYFRMGIPKELRGLIGKSEFKSSLQTKDLKEAKLHFPPLLADANKQIELARLKLNPTSIAKLSPFDCAILAERWYERVKAELDSSGDYKQFLDYEEKYNFEANELHVHAFGLTDTFDFRGPDAAQAEEVEYAELRDGLEPYIVAELDRELLIVGRESASFRLLVGAFYDYLRKIEAFCMARFKRDYGYDAVTNRISDKPLSVSSVTVSQAHSRSIAPQNSISKVLARYVESATINGKASQSLTEIKGLVERLIEVIGDIDVTEVTRGHIAQYRDVLLQLPKSKAQSIRNQTIEKQVELVKAEGLATLTPATVKTILRKSSPVFGYAVELGLIEVNLLQRRNST
ncbi:DUF6538 domain-containing protein [Vibrio sp. DNB22_17_1]